MKLFLVLLLGALAAQAAMLDGLAWLWESAYREPRVLDEALELPLTWTGLALGGPLALALGSTAIYAALRRARSFALRAALVVLVTPSLLAATLTTHVLLALAGIW
ncbi:MAG: hypothetical protein JNM84_07915 [Planctomycetes bacterium]|nr:hypothetical protein [Planctomycetota bacterium]